VEKRIRRITRQRMSHFVLGEEGKVGSRSTLVAATVVVVTSLATMLLGVTHSAKAASICGWAGMCYTTCCFWSGPPQNYACVPQALDPPWVCWPA